MADNSFPSDKSSILAKKIISIVYLIKLIILLYFRWCYVQASQLDFTLMKKSKWEEVCNKNTSCSAFILAGVSWLLLTSLSLPVIRLIAFTCATCASYMQLPGSHKAGRLCLLCRLFLSSLILLCLPGYKFRSTITHLTSKRACDDV